MKLHPAQRDFLNSPALFRAFAGGIGSGKSWAGAYDLIKRAKPDRLYMILCPTYAMLADATFRSFTSLAEELGVLDPLEIKRGAPPSLKLRTGAEILFRSADEPDRLRGPNLSGIWLDEASGMPLSAFSIAIGRLREGGEQGFLTATFTPKGRTHWTYDVFATGKPDTAIFHARTQDNPFLPQNFHGTVRKQYTSHMAAQELEGLFIDAAGTMFKRDWFAVVDALPTMVSCVRAWDLAATADTGKNDPDYSAGALLGRDASGGIYVLDVKRRRGTPAEIQQLVKVTALADGGATEIWMEEEGGSSGKIAIDHYRRNILPGFNFRSERSTGSKSTRAAPFAAMAEGGAVKLLRGAWNKDFLDEIEIFPAGGHDDQVDAASLAFTKVATSDWGEISAAPRSESLMANMPLGVHQVDAYRTEGALNAPDERDPGDDESAGFGCGAYDW